MKKMNSAFLDLKASIGKSKLEEFLQNKIKIKENLPLGEEEDNNNNNNIDSNLNEIIENLKNCLELINNYLKPKGYIKFISNYLFNDSFGSLFEMRQRLKNEFNCYDKILRTKDNKILETYLFLLYFYFILLYFYFNFIILKAF
jgi:hypothetical protein